MAYDDNVNIDGASVDARDAVNELWPCIRMANALKAAYNLHIADVGEHTAGADGTNIVTAADAGTLATLITLVKDIIHQYGHHDDDAELGGLWAFHAAQEAANHTFASVVAPTTLADCVTLLADMQAKYNAHDADGTAHGTDTQHQLTIDDAYPVTSAIAELQARLVELKHLNATASVRGSYTYTDAGGTQAVITFTPIDSVKLSGIFLDLNAMTQNGTVTVSYQIDGTNARDFHTVPFAIATSLKGMYLDIPAIIDDAIVVNYTEGANEGAARSIPFAYIFENKE
jgi:hypothetical protein